MKSITPLFSLILLCFFRDEQNVSGIRQEQSDSAQPNTRHRNGDDQISLLFHRDLRELRQQRPLSRRDHHRHHSKSREEYESQFRDNEQDVFGRSSSQFRDDSDFEPESKSIDYAITARATDVNYRIEQLMKTDFEENHDPLFPLTKRDKIGFICAFLGLLIAAWGGIGGGGILVPIYILVMEFTPKHAIPLSNVTIFGGALANMILNWRKRHPLADRPLVDWDVILVMEPLTIGGALVGAFLNNIIPEIVLAIMLVALLLFMTYNTLKKAAKMHRQETALIEKSAVKEASVPSELTNDVEQSKKESYIPIAGDKVAGTEEAENYAELQQIITSERRTPVSNVAILVLTSAVVLTINILKGGEGFESPLGIKCGSFSYWLANFTMLAWVFLVMSYVKTYLSKKFETKQRVGYQYAEGDIRWDDKALRIYPVVCSLAGFFAGMFGVGGGIVKGPLMIALGVHPAVASATSACMILFTSSTAATSFFVYDLLDPTYSPMLFIIGFVATFFGQVLLSVVMKLTHQRNSYITFSIGFVVLISAILMTVQSWLTIASGVHHKTVGICGTDSAIVSGATYDNYRFLQDSIQARPGYSSWP